MFWSRTRLREREKYFILRKNFKIPDWWYDINNYSPSDTLEPDWRKVSEINFATGLSPEVDEKRELSIYSVLFIRNNNRVIFYMLMILTGTGLLLFVQLLALKDLIERHISSIPPSF